MAAETLPLSRQLSLRQKERRTAHDVEDYLVANKRCDAALEDVLANLEEWHRGVETLCVRIDRGGDMR